ncbi:DUF1109 domain-containing protein [Novosphingobium sp.]|uniref:DUF1109 domain-containing protein n=1 Tax=Novosphingobium sp. TaxID=1874826 RepID=UPI0025E37F83|nr:DUF1109 domain-containing protein [Novosphingobium sp.]MCC6924933.1 DUF1109 domain-containing protein [Novosphingobium sp.]
MPKSTDDLIAGLVDDLHPVRPLRQARGMLLAVLALIAGALGMAGFWPIRTDLVAARPDGMFLLSASLFLVLGLASAWAVIDMARPAVGMRREGWGWTALMAATLPLAAAALLAFELARGMPLAIDRDGLGCMRFGLGWSVLTFAALVWWLRRGAPVLPQRAGLLTGVAAGAAGIFAVSLYCPHNDLVHIGIWHGLTVVLAGLIGRIAVPRLIAW